MKKITVLYGLIVFEEDSATIKSLKNVEVIEADSLELCEEIAEQNAGFYGGDYLIPSIFSGQIFCKG